MTKEEFITLYEKCISGNCTDQELKLLEQFQDEFELSRHPWSAEMGDYEAVRKQIADTVRMRILAPRKTLRLWPGLAAAASLLLLLSAGVWFYYTGRANKESTHAVQMKTGILPGGNKAFLILADGSQVDLDGSENGRLSQQGDTLVTTLSNGRKIYDTRTTMAKNSPAAYQTIVTPRGGQYELTLSDGTKVRLNAASSLKYPVVFSGTERTVELQGEAFFEVAKNKKFPFRVLTRQMDVQVLGTRFNVMAYPDEQAVTTTLVEGSVKLLKGRQERLLSPGQQGLLQQGTEVFQVHNVNVDEAISWTKGLFTFNQENIQSIMRRVARWYDVEVQYQGNLQRQNFGGSVSRFEDISHLLKTLELTGTVHFKLEGRRVTVMP